MLFITYHTVGHESVSDVTLCALETLSESQTVNQLRLQQSVSFSFRGLRFYIRSEVVRSSDHYEKILVSSFDINQRECGM